MTSSYRPRTIKLEQISLQVIGEETLLYDTLHHQAWCLNRSSACIWHLCDGQRDVQQIAAAGSKELNAQVTEDIVVLALAELREKNLLEPETATALPDSVTRREMLSRAGLAAAAILPVVASILAPPAHAQTGSMVGTAALAKFPRLKSSGDLLEERLTGHKGSSD
jgi:hypothetical protein